MPGRDSHASQFPRSEAPEVVLYTMGPGDDLFSQFGHAAICIRNRCYNYGTADFSRPLPLVIDVLRGRARFWVATQAPGPMLAWYRRADRAIYRQVIPLAPDEIERLRALMNADVGPENAYVYHHFRENCTTRLRDRLDQATGGRLRRHAETVSDDAHPLRARVDAGLVRFPSLELLADLVVGRPVDRRPSRWEAMFLPDILRDEVAATYGAPPEQLHARRAAPPAGSGPLTWLVPVAGFALAALAALAGLSGSPGLRRAGGIAAGVVLGLLGALVWGVAASSALPELRHNELVLVFVPFDAILIGRNRSRLVRGYLSVRIVGVALASALHAAGLLVQPLLGQAALALAFLVPLWIGAGSSERRRDARRDGRGPSPDGP